MHLVLSVLLSQTRAHIGENNVLPMEPLVCEGLGASHGCAMDPFLSHSALCWLRFQPPRWGRKHTDASSSLHNPGFSSLPLMGDFSVPISSHNVLLPCAIYFWSRLPLSDFAQCPTISTYLKRWLYVSVTMHDVWSGNEHMGNIGPCTEACMCGGLRTAFSSLFPFTFTWISGMEFRSHRLALPNVFIHWAILLASVFWVFF